MNLTSEQEELAKKTLAKDGQKSVSSKMVENPHVKKIYVDVDEKDTLIIPVDAPEL